MYIHAYQSYVWNCIVSERVKGYGLKPIVGDLVFETTSVEEEQEDVKDLQGDINALASGGLYSAIESLHTVNSEV